MSDNMFKITIASHNFKVHARNAVAKQLCLKFASKFLYKKLERQRGGRYIEVNDKVFAAATSDRQFFRFHINTYTSFINFLKENLVNLQNLEIVTLPIPVGESVKLEMNKIYTMRDYQKNIVDYIDDDDPKNRAKLTQLQTGKGKGLISIQSMVNEGTRCCWIIKPGFIKKMIKEFEEKLVGLKKGDIVAVNGSEELKQLLLLAKHNELKAKIILISNRTYQPWVSNFEKFGSTKELGYCCEPEDLFEHLNVGYRIVDEVHLDWHLNFKLDLYTNVNKSLSMSATLVNNNSFIENTYKIAFPPEYRHAAIPLDKYSYAVGLKYEIHPKFKYKTKGGRGNYSHLTFEESILKNKEFTAAYFKLIDETVDIQFFDDRYKPGHKCIVFFATVAMCSEYKKHLVTIYPKLKISTFCGTLKDPLENLLESDISLTTVGSGGTGHDVPMLTTSILTVAINSIQANIQSFGRLRKLENIDTKFVFFGCRNIPKHMEYYKNKVQTMDDRAKHFSELMGPLVY